MENSTIRNSTGSIGSTIILAFLFVSRFIIPYHSSFSFGTSSEELYSNSNLEVIVKAESGNTHNDLNIPQSSLPPLETNIEEDFGFEDDYSQFSYLLAGQLANYKTLMLEHYFNAPSISIASHIPLYVFFHSWKSHLS